jgi:fucose permease
MGTILVGLLMMLLTKNEMIAVIGFAIAGFGCAPIFPCIIHNTPTLFGAERSQSIIGVQMASFYAGTCLFPPLFGIVADWIGIGCMPAVLLGALCVMLLLYCRFCRLSKG